jgi:hypothetical protein
MYVAGDQFRAVLVGEQAHQQDRLANAGIAKRHRGSRLHDGETDDLR